MENNEKSCPICGEPTYLVYGKHPRKDGLCGKHATMLKNGEIFVDAKGIFIDAKAKKVLNADFYKKDTANTNDNKTQCIICNSEANKGYLCKTCWEDMQNYKDTFNKNSKMFELKEHYFNLRSSIYRMQNFEYVKSNCKKLIALAMLSKDLYTNDSLADRIESDVKKIIEDKTPKENSKTQTQNETDDAHKEELTRTEDGHYVKSYPESVIDDILYEVRIVHCYEKKLPISDKEQTVKSDWFIPVLDNRHGIFIEYWGMNTPDYINNKNRKLETYKKYDFPLIEIQKDDYKTKSILTDQLIAEINYLAEKHFGVKNFIK